MKLILDNLIFSWQKSGGVSVFWGYLVKLALRLQPQLRLTMVEYPHASDNIVRKQLDLSQQQLHLLKPRCFTFHKYQHLRLREEQEPFLFHSSYYRVSTHPQAINVVTVHDFTYERFLSGPKRWLHTWQKRRTLAKADAIVCVSHHTAADLKHYFPEVPQHKIHVIYNGVDATYTPMSVEEQTAQRARLLLPAAFLLFVGSRAGYKQFQFSAQVAQSMHLPLIIVGSPLSAQEKKHLDALKVQYDERHFVPNQELRAYYALATALLYPSLYEGFGIPVIEAQRCGCPVLAYKASSIPEVIGEGYPLLLSSLSLSTATQLLQRLSTDLAFREQTIQQGLKNSQRFSWDKMQEDYHQLYLQLWKSHVATTSSHPS